MVKVEQDFFLCLQETGFVVGDTLVTAKLLDKLLCLPELVLRHCGKEVMFDLVVEPTVEKVG